MLGGIEVLKKSKKSKLILIREPSGRPARSEEQKETAPAQVKRLRDAALAGMADAEWGTELGRLYLINKITAPMYSAGKRWAERARRYRWAINCPPDSPRSSSAERSGFSSPPDPDSERGLGEAKTDSEAVKVFLEAHAVLLGAGLLAERAVRSLCEDDVVMAGEIHSIALHKGLLWLVDHWQLTEAPKRARRNVR